jgi:hypothetical protein
MQRRSQRPTVRWASITPRWLHEVEGTDRRFLNELKREKA